MAINKIVQCIIIFYAEVLNYAKTLDVNKLET